MSNPEYRQRFGPRIRFTSAVAEELGSGADALPGEPIGIGLCDALLNMQEQLHHLAIDGATPDLMVFVGTAGALPDSALRIGSVVQARCVLLGDAALALQLGYSPRHPGGLYDGEQSPMTLPGIPAVTVLTNLAITTDPALARTLALPETAHAFGQPISVNRGADATAGRARVENMEAYGFGLACARQKVPWAVVLGITNDVGVDAHAQWRANRSAAEAAARRAARNAADSIVAQHAIPR